MCFAWASLDTHHLQSKCFQAYNWGPKPNVTVEALGTAKTKRLNNTEKWGQEGAEETYQQRKR